MRHKFLVEFGWHVIAEDAEEARKLAKKNLKKKSKREIVDSLHIRRLDEHRL